MTQEEVRRSCMGRTLAEYRSLAKLNQTKIGKSLGVHRNTVCRWEQGIKEISLWEFLDLCDELNIRAEDIIQVYRARLNAIWAYQLQKERDRPISPKEEDRLRRPDGWQIEH